MLMTTTTKTNTVEAVQYVKDLIQSGRKVGVFSCEDPYNTPFHRDLLQKTDYMLLKQIAAGKVEPATLDLGLQAKGINTWGVFGHYGDVHGHEVCAAIKALSSDYSNFGSDLRKHIDLLSKQYQYQTKKTLRENITDWVRTQYELLLKIIPEKQKTLKGAVQGDIVIFGGVVENSEDGKSYKSHILFSNQNGN